MWRVWMLGFFILATLGDAALGQSLFRSSGGIFPTPNELNRRHMAPTGKPCLAFEAYAKAQAVNKNIYEHWVGAKNSCGQHIKVQVCYYQSHDCIIMDVPPWDRQDSVLGIYPALKEFRYETKEQF
jgi:hypothetical protein